MKHVKNLLILKSARGALGALLTTPFVLGAPLAHGSPVALAAVIMQDASPARLYGTWTAKGVDAKMGEVRIRLTFRREGKASLLAWSDIPFVGQVRDLEGPFTVQGDTISSVAIHDGRKAKFSFEIDQLVLRFKSGKVVRFNRE